MTTEILTKDRYRTAGGSRSKILSVKSTLDDQLGLVHPGNLVNYVILRAVGRSENPGVPVVIRWA